MQLVQYRVTKKRGNKLIKTAVKRQESNMDGSVTFPLPSLIADNYVDRCNHHLKQMRANFTERKFYGKVEINLVYNSLGGNIFRNVGVTDFVKVVELC